MNLIKNLEEKVNYENHPTTIQTADSQKCQEGF